MIVDYRAVRAVATRVEAAIVNVTAAYLGGRVEQEPEFTGRMLGAIEYSLQEFETNGIVWKAKTLTDRGRGSQESQYGADFVGVLNIELREYTVSKGFLAQAKLLRNGRIDDLHRLRRQCETMLSLSPASFVFLYSGDGVQVIPAISVISAADPLRLYARTSRRFFEDHLQCFIGDPAIHSASTANLEELADRYQARMALLIEGRPQGIQARWNFG